MGRTHNDLCHTVAVLTLTCMHVEEADLIGRQFADMHGEARGTPTIAFCSFAALRSVAPAVDDGC